MTQIEINGEKIIVDGEQVEPKSSKWNAILPNYFDPDILWMPAENQIVAAAIELFRAKAISGDYVDYLKQSANTVY